MAIRGEEREGREVTSCFGGRRGNKGSQYWVCGSWHPPGRAVEVGGAARGGSLWTGERAGHGQAGGSPIAGARKPALDVLQEKPELKRGSFKSKERFELKRHSESKID